MSGNFINVVVVGASGYVGAELVSILLQHPLVKIKSLAGDSSAGAFMSELYPSFSETDSKLGVIVHVNDLDFSCCDVVFLCLPHGKSSFFLRRIPTGIKIIDLSADFRLQNLEVYTKIYGEHGAPSSLDNFVFGLSECYRSELLDAKFISCPGCYSTASLLPLIPLAEHADLDISSIIIDAKSGVSGAGRVASVKNSFCEVNNTFRAYAVDSKHRHTFEINQEILLRLSDDGSLRFNGVHLTTHIIPINRGMMCSIYLPCNTDLATDVLKKYYSSSYFVSVDNSKCLDLRSVIATNKCYIGVFSLGGNGSLIISVIDNLLKGAAGQALQNFNISFGFDDFYGFNSYIKTI